MSTQDTELDKLRAVDQRVPDDFRERFERYTGEELEVMSRADGDPRIDYETYVRDWVDEVLSASPEATRSSTAGAGSTQKR